MNYLQPMAAGSLEWSTKIKAEQCTALYGGRSIFNHLNETSTQNNLYLFKHALHYFFTLLLLFTLSSKPLDSIDKNSDFTSQYKVARLFKKRNHRFVTHFYRFMSGGTNGLTEPQRLDGELDECCFFVCFVF